MDDSGKLLRVIRQKCIYCCGGSTKEAARCTSEECPLWAYRPQSTPPAQRRRSRGTVQITMSMVLETKGGRQA